MRNVKSSKSIISQIIIYALIILLLLGFIAFGLFFLGNAEPQANPESQNLSDNTVVRIIDGDTFELASGEIVRLICVDTPETGGGSDGAEEAAQFLSLLILDREVRLENDSDDKDAYGRLLRYVYVNVSYSDGEIFVNKEIVEQGYGSVFRYGNDTARCDEIGG